MNLRTKITLLTVGFALSITTTFLFSSCGRQQTAAETSVTVDSAQPPAKASADNTPKKVVTRLAPNLDRVVYLEGVVGMQSSMIAANIKQKAAQSNAPIYLVINSPGGSVLDGALIISAIEASRAPVYTVCTQLCASMAAMIFEYGTKRLMVDRAIVMFHPASGGAEGEVDKMVSRLHTIQRYIGKMEAHVAKRAGLTFAEYKAHSGRELWIDGEDAVNSNFADSLVSVLLPDHGDLSLLQSGDKTNNATVNPITQFNLDWIMSGNPFSFY